MEKSLIDYNGDFLHSGSAPWAGHHVQRVGPGKQPRPGLPAGEHADLLVLLGLA